MGTPARFAAVFFCGAVLTSAAARAAGEHEHAHPAGAHAAADGAMECVCPQQVVVTKTAAPKTLAKPRKVAPKALSSPAPRKQRPAALRKPAQQQEVVTQMLPCPCPEHHAAAPPPQPLVVTETMALEADSEIPTWCCVYLLTWGETHYNNYEDYTADLNFNRLELHRAGLGLLWPTSKGTRFVVEGEVEHAWSSDDEDDDRRFNLPQAYFEIDLRKNLFLRGGNLLVPVGFLNELHEPTAFYGVERNAIEGEVFPTLWYAPGIGLGGAIPGTERLGFDLAVQTGLRTPGFGEPNAYRLRNGARQRGDPDASSAGITGRLRYALTDWLLVGTGVHYQNDIRQGLDPERVPAWMNEVHAAAQWWRFDLKGVWATWRLDSPLARLEERDEQEGGLAEAGFRVFEQLGVFTQYQDWDVGGVLATGVDTHKKEILFGAVWWPWPNLALKFDAYDQDGPNRESDGFEAGIAWTFPSVCCGGRAAKLKPWFRSTIVETWLE